MTNMASSSGEGRATSARRRAGGSFSRYDGVTTPSTDIGGWAVSALTTRTRRSAKSYFDQRDIGDWAVESA